MPTGMSTYFPEAFWVDESDNVFVANDLCGQCTWYAYSKAHVKAAAYPERGIDPSNIPRSAAGSWANDASPYYETGSTPKADSIACWSGGHVAYVETVDGDDVCFSEANWYSNTNPGSEIVVPAAHLPEISANVAQNNSNITVKSTTTNNQAGTDGQFKTMSSSSFASRKSGTLTYIYIKEPKS